MSWESHGPDAAGEATATNAVRPGTWRDVVVVSGPLVVSMLSYTLMGVVDTLLVARLGQAEVASVGLATAATFTLVCFGMGLMNSVKIAVAQAHGAGDAARSRSLAWHGVALGAVVGGLLLLLMPVTAPMADLMAGEGRVGPLAGQYFAIRLWGALPLFVAMGSFGFFDGRGLTKVAMRINVAANLVNIGLDVVFIFGLGPIPAMGVAGAAVATVFSQVLQGVCGLWLLWSAAGSPRRVRFSRRRLMRLLDLGLPMGTQWSLEVASWAVFAGIVARAGEAHLAAHTIVVRIISLSFLPTHAIGDATSILTGQAIGGGAPESARRACRSAGHVALVFTALLGVGFLTSGTWLIELFRSDPEVLEVGGTLLMIGAVFQLAESVAMTRAGALSGVGDTRFVMMVSVGLAWVSLVPLAWYFAIHRGMGAPGAWIALSLHIGAVAAVHSMRWRSERPIANALRRAAEDAAEEAAIAAGTTPEGEPGRSDAVDCTA